MTETNTDWSDTTPRAEDWEACDWRPGEGVVPERALVDLPDVGEVNVLFYIDVDCWRIVSAHSIDDGAAVALSPRERDLVLRKLNERAAEQRADWLADGNYVDARFRSRWA